MIAGGCLICGGTAGDSRQTAHALCRVRREMGLPTPSLGDACPCCHGVGTHPSSARGPMNPSDDAIDRWAPGCTTCNATGSVRGDESLPITRRAPRHWSRCCLAVAG